MSKVSDMLYHLGGVPVIQGLPYSKNSDYYFVDPANGSASGNGTLDDPCDKVSTAYALCTANQHDTVIYIAGSSSCTEAAAITWSKSYTHLIGIAAPSHAGKRARIFQGASLTDSPWINITGSGCIFKNLYLFSGVADSDAKIAVQVTGGRNYFENVHFAGGGHATSAINAGAALKLNGAEECKFVDCTFGVDTAAQGTGWVAILLDAEARRLVFEDCLFTMYTSNKGAAFVEVADNAGIDRYIIFKDCLFIQDSATGMNSAFVVPAGMGVPRGPIVLQNCAVTGADDWEDQDRGVVFAAMGTYTAGGNSGIMETVAAT